MLAQQSGNRSAGGKQSTFDGFQQRAQPVFTNLGSSEYSANEAYMTIIPRKIVASFVAGFIHFAVLLLFGGGGEGGRGGGVKKGEARGNRPVLP